VPQDPEPRITAARVAELGRRGIAAAVVDVDHLELHRALQGGVDLGDQRADVLRLVSDGNDYG
jgi:hypothetical protein